MKISKLKALWALCTGGWGGLAVYLLDAVNAELAKFTPVKFAQSAQAVKCFANAVNALEPILPARYANSIKATFASLNVVASTFADGKITALEYDESIDALKSAVGAWKSVK